MEKILHTPLAEQLRISGQRHVPWVISGIGPESGKDFIIAAVRQNSSARRDQEHMGYGLVMATGMPDRTTALTMRISGDESMYNDVRKRLLLLAHTGRREGFDFLITLCNTIHAWRDDLKEELRDLGIPWLGIMDAVTTDLRTQYPKGTKIAIVATTGTLRTRLYNDALSAQGFIPVAPEIDSPIQADVMAAIYDTSFGIKARGATPEATNQLIHAVEWAQAQGAPVVICGCTEIPLALNEETYHGTLRLMNPMDSLARETIRYAFYPQAQFSK